MVKTNMHPSDTILKLVYKREFFDVSVMRNVARSVPPSMLTARLFSKSISQATEKQNPCTVAALGFCAAELKNASQPQPGKIFMLMIVPKIGRIMHDFFEKDVVEDKSDK